ncbi:hypothetical protein EPO44_22010 [bacterium]|nr:MAG: hypothetical protein EPO44_22010 [bacterium]
MAGSHYLFLFASVFSGLNTHPPSTAYSFILLYIFSNAALYWIDERMFEASYFYAPLVLLDTFCATATLMVSGQVTTDFYLVYFVLIILCAVFEDFLGLMTVAGLSILVYGYLLFNTAEALDPGSYLRLPFLFVVALFYGYFAHIVHGEKALKVQSASSPDHCRAASRSRAPKVGIPSQYHTRA